MPEVSFAQAVNRALASEMRNDPSVIVFGEDVGQSGGTFSVTRGLHQEFGPRRVMDTPISEAAIAGAAVGAAMCGLRPVVEIMFMDFITLAMDALVNQAAKARFMFGGQASVPMVVRTPHGGNLTAGPQHSQCLEAWFAHVPGLKVVCPSDAQSAHDLLIESIRDPNPVVFIENRWLYKFKGGLDTERRLYRLGEARVVRAGSDVTLVTYGAGVRVCLAAAVELAAHDIASEVIDLGTIQPWDRETVGRSVSKTGRLVVVHEAVKEFGVGAEIAAHVAEHSFSALKGPVCRIGAPFMPSPFSPDLEKHYVPSAADVVDQVRRQFAAAAAA